MKSIAIFFFSTIFIFLLVGCTVIDTGTKTDNTLTTSQSEASNPNKASIDVIDNKTNQVVLTLNEMQKDTRASIVLSTIHNNLPTKDKIKTTPNYTIHLIDNGNSLYDIWLNVYLKKECVYIQFIPEKIRFENDYTDEIRKSRVNRKEFIKIFNNQILGF